MNCLICKHPLTIASTVAVSGHPGFQRRECRCPHCLTEQVITQRVTNESPLSEKELELVMNRPGGQTAA